MTEKNIDSQFLFQLQQGAQAFLQCFTYTLPDLLQIYPNDPIYNFNCMEHDPSDFVFRPNPPQNQNNGTNCAFLADDGFKFDAYILPSDNEQVRLIKKVYNETKNEIARAYPSLSKIADSICLHNYMSHLSHHIVQNDEGLLDKIAVFKIECWEMTDEEADQHVLMQYYLLYDFGENIHTKFSVDISPKITEFL